MRMRRSFPGCPGSGRFLVPEIPQHRKRVLEKRSAFSRLFRRRFFVTVCHRSGMPTPLTKGTLHTAVFFREGTMNITVTVNGQTHAHDVEPRLLLVHYLREKLGLTGTHVGCETSLCGACTIYMNG